MTCEPNSESYGRSGERMSEDVNSHTTGEQMPEDIIIFPGPVDRINGCRKASCSHIVCAGHVRVCLSGSKRGTVVPQMENNLWNNGSSFLFPFPASCGDSDKFSLNFQPRISLTAAAISSHLQSAKNSSRNFSPPSAPLTRSRSRSFRISGSGR